MAAQDRLQGLLGGMAELIARTHAPTFIQYGHFLTRGMSSAAELLLLGLACTLQQGFSRRLGTSSDASAVNYLAGLGICSGQ